MNLKKKLSSLLLIMALCGFYISFGKVSYAGFNVSTMNTDVVTSIFNYFKQQGVNFYTNYTYDLSSGELGTILNLINKQELANKFNTEYNNFVTNREGNYSFDNVIMTISKTTNSINTQNEIVFDFWISNSYGVNDLQQLRMNRSNANFYIRPHTTGQIGRIEIKYNIDGTFSTSSNNAQNDTYTLKYTYPTGGISTTNYISNMATYTNNGVLYNPAFLALSKDYTYYWSGDNIGNGFYTNSSYINVVTMESEDTTSANGYYFYDSNNNATQVDLKSSTPVYLDEYWYIGDNLSYSYQYYYMSGDTKINTNKISLNQTRNSGDTGTFYKPYIKVTDLQYLNNNTGYYLELSVSKNNDSVTLANNWYSFVTYIEPMYYNPTINITTEQYNNSGELIGTTTQSGEINISDFWGTENQLEGTTQENQIQDIINGTYDNISGELTSGEAFGMIQSAQNKIIDIFNYGKNDANLLDFVISWNNITYTDPEGKTTKIISGDSINFTKMAEENETLGLIQIYIRTILCFSISWALVVQIYNLILSTLGIDNPYLYQEQEDVYNVDYYEDNLGNIKKDYVIKRGNGNIERYRKYGRRR